MWKKIIEILKILIFQYFFNTSTSILKRVPGRYEHDSGSLREHKLTQSYTFEALQLRIHWISMDEHFLVQNQWISFWILMEILGNNQNHRAVTRVLLGVRGQVIYQKVPTPRAWSIARVKSRVARFYAWIFLWWAESNSWNFSSGDADHPTYIRSNVCASELSAHDHACGEFGHSYLLC